MLRFARVVALLSLASVGGCSCEQPTTLADIEVERATLSELFFIGFGMLGSLRTGTAHLEIEDTSGEVFDVDVKMSMTVAGGLMEMTLATVDGGEGDYDLSRIDAPNGADLLGNFEGLALSAGMLLGGGLLNLENERHAEVTLAGLEGVFGLTLTSGHVWAGIEVAPENECEDGLDDDLDGAFDCDDSDCDDVTPCNFVPPVAPPLVDDAGVSDAGDLDAGDDTGADAGEDVDAGESDAGEDVSDAGEDVDAGGDVDAGEDVSDAGVIDAGDG